MPDPRPIAIVGHQFGLLKVFRADDYREEVRYLGPSNLDPEWEDTGFAEVVRRREARPGRGGEDLEWVIWWCPVCQR